MTKEEAKEYLDNYRKMYAELAPERFLEALDIMLNEPSLPSNLDEAAREYCKDKMNYDDSLIFHRQYLAQIFKAGAEWAFGQGETVGTYVDIAKNDEEEFLCVLADVETFKKGDKVVVQIRKAE